MKQPKVILDFGKWQQIVAMATSNAKFRAFTLFQLRGTRYPCTVVDFQEIEVKSARPGVFRFPG